MRRLLGIILIGGVLLPGCKDDSPTGDDGSPSNIVFPASNVSYQYHVQPLFDQACNFSGCHGANAPPNTPQLTSWGVMMMSPGVVVPGEPQNSTLVARIEGRGAIMPPTGPTLNTNQKSGIATWIAEGAKNN